MIEYITAALVGVAIGTAVGLFMSRRNGGREELERLRQEAEEAVRRARAETESAVRAEAEALTRKAADELEQTRNELRKRETVLRKREDTVEKRDEQLTSREAKLGKREKDVGRRERKIEQQEHSLQETLTDARGKLQSAAALTQEEARAILLDELREDARRASIDEIRAIERESAALGEERARMIVSAAIQRYASEHVTDRTVTTVALPSDEVKGRIIGREGRNIRAFEAATGCDLIVDDTPNAVVISGFNPVRREVARVAMEKLLADGRIHPARIEEVVARAQTEVDQIVRRHGEEAAMELEIAGLHPEIIKALGRLHFTLSFAQNVLRHSIEVGFLAGLMASELGVSAKIARRAGLLHDIGKAVEHDAEGSHAEVGAAFCRKHGENKAVVQAIAAHHDEVVPNSVIALLVAAANRLSAERPGARREALGAHIKRLEELEEMVGTFGGVERCYAIQSGQELQVIVDNAKLSDRDSDLLARDIARRIEREMSYSGEVKVTVIRQTRAVQYAR